MGAKISISRSGDGKKLTVKVGERFLSVDTETFSVAQRTVLATVEQLNVNQLTAELGVNAVYDEVVKARRAAGQRALKRYVALYHRPARGGAITREDYVWVTYDAPPRDKDELWGEYA